MKPKTIMPLKTTGKQKMATKQKKIKFQKQLEGKDELNIYLASLQKKPINVSLLLQLQTTNQSI